MQSLVIRLYRNEDGATMIEYALMLSLITLACIAAVNYLQGSLSNSFNHSANSI